MDKISIDNFAKEVSKRMNEYVSITNEDFEKAVEEITNETLDIVKTNASKIGGKVYKKSFKKSIDRKSLQVKAVISNKQYQLAHLLENGHALKRGGRTIGKGNTKAFPHFSKGQEYIDSHFEQRVKNKLEGK